MAVDNKLNIFLLLKGELEEYMNTTFLNFKFVFYIQVCHALNFIPYLGN